MSLPKNDLAQRTRVPRWLLATVLLVALAPRLYVALTTAYVWDEDRDWVAVAESISLDPADLNLPLRSAGHPALPAYLIRAGATIAGHGPFGHRLASLVAGLVAVGLITLVGFRWGGLIGGLAAGAALALNEYHIAFSAIAIARIFYLTFGLVAIVAFASFLDTERPRYLYGAVVAAALGFLCKETAVLLLVVGAATLLYAKASWYRRREPYLAVLLFLVIISPDLWWQLTVTSDVQAGYQDHLARIVGLGLTYQPFVFFGREAVQGALELLGRPFVDSASEYPTMNWVMGLLLAFGSLAAVANRHLRAQPRTVFLFGMFAFPVAFFSLLETREAESALDVVAWNWTDIALLPAVFLTAIWIARLPSRPRAAVLGVGVVAVGISLSRIPGSFGLPPAQLGVCPDWIRPDEGQYVPVQASLHRCATCSLDSDDLVLRDIVRRGDGESMIDADFVRGAERGTSDWEFEVRAVSRDDGQPLFYAVRYETTPEPGSEPAFLVANVMISNEIRHGPQFWACGGPGLVGNDRLDPADIDPERVMR